MFANSLGGLLLAVAARHGAPTLWQPSAGTAAFFLAAFLVCLLHVCLIELMPCPAGRGGCVIALNASEHVKMGCVFQGLNV